MGDWLTIPANTSTADQRFPFIGTAETRGAGPSSDQTASHASEGFRSFAGAWRTVQGYEVIHMIRKGQVKWLPKGDVVGQILFIHETLGLRVA